MEEEKEVLQAEEDIVASLPSRGRSSRKSSRQRREQQKVLHAEEEQLILHGVKSWEARWLSVLLEKEAKYVRI